MNKLQRIHVTISERIDGWILQCNDNTIFGFDKKYYATAAEAQRAVKNRATIMAENGISTVFNIEWVTSTKLGKLIVKAVKALQKK